MRNEVHSIPPRPTVPPPMPFNVPTPTPGKPKVSWPGLGIVTIAIWVLFLGGLDVIVKTSGTIRTGATRMAQTITLPTAIVPTATPFRVPTKAPIVGPIAPVAIVAASIAASSISTPTQTPPEACELATWQDGSQSCRDGRPIDAEHSQAGYCTPIRNTDGTSTCTNGQPAGAVDWSDPEVAAEPANTPWPAEPAEGTVWSAAVENDGRTCVTVRFADGHAQTACTVPGRHLSDETIKFVARMIEDGRIAPGAGVPNG